MKIVKKRKFIRSLSAIFEYIAQDKPLAAKIFKETLYKKLKPSKLFLKCIENQYILMMKIIGI